MTPAQIALVRTSFRHMMPHTSAVGMAFYGDLFRFHPDLRVMFGDDLPAQTDKLMGMLANIVDALEKPTQLFPLLRAMGERHALYGVQDEHYDIVGGVLINALRFVQGARFGAETEAAWIALYSKIAAQMIAGAHGQAEAC